MEKRIRGRIGIAANLLYSTLRLIARHVHGFFGALGTFVTIGLIVGAIAVGIFAGIAELVDEGLTQSFDEAALQWFETHRNPILDKIMVEITTLGTGVVLIMIVLVSSVFLWQTQHRWSVYLLLFGVLGGKLLNTLLKAIYERERPSVVGWVTDVYSPSFPSGHAMSSMVVYGSVAYLVARLEGQRRMRVTTYILAVITIVLIGVSRMYLGVHYPSDVLAGFLGGLAWLTFVVALMTALQFFAKRRPEVHAEERDLHVDADVNQH